MRNPRRAISQHRMTITVMRRCILTLALGPLFNQAMAADFYTIIGPDGRPIVIQRSPSSATEPAHGAPTQQLKPQRTQSVTPASTVVYPAVRPAVSDVDNKKPASETSSTVANVQPERMEALPTQRAAGQISTSLKSVIPAQLNMPNRSSVGVQATHDTTAASVSTVVGRSTSNPANQSLEQAQTQVQNQAQHQMASTVQPGSPITEIDGVKYVDQEFLEENEFNLDGRKRFYMVMDNSQGGVVRFETVERQKGISRTILSKFLKPYQPEQLEPLALSASYLRIDKADVEESLGQACFSGKKLQKAKRLKAKNGELGLWPVPPLQEEFAYEVVEVDPVVNQIQIESYAFSKKKPTYYWPLVVFLDQKGCVVEGVTGFKSHQGQENVVKYASLEGVVKKPQSAAYLFMTPLAEAMDAQHALLSNRGQIKLKVLN